MTLDEYRARINEVAQSSHAPNGALLTEQDKATSLDLIASEIAGAAWRPWARAEAAELVALARSLITVDPDLDGLESLASKGLLRAL